MNEYLKKALLLGVGVNAIKKSLLDKLMNELQQRGEVTEKEAEKLIKELLQKAKVRAVEEQRKIKELVKTEVVRRGRELGFVTKNDLERLYGLKVLKNPAKK